MSANPFSGARHLLHPDDPVMLKALGTAVQWMGASLALTKAELSKLSPLDPRTRDLAIQLAYGQPEYLEFRAAWIAAKKRVEG